MLLIGNGRLITRDDAGTFFDNGCLAIEGKFIKKVGTTCELLQEYPKAEFIDAKGGVIMPGLINTHNHIYSAFARGLSMNNYNPGNFLDILEGMWWKIDRTLNLEDTYHSAMVTYLDCIKNGVTTVFDHHASYGAVEGSLFKLSEAADQFGIRTSLCYEISDRDGKARMEAAVQENAEFAKACMKRSDDMQKAMIGMHAAFTISDETFAYTRENTPAGTGYHIHVAEGIGDVYDSLKKYGKPIVNRLFDNGILGDKTLAIHCIHVNPREMEILRDTGTAVVVNPESNMGNAVGCPPAMQMFHKYGILMGLGTDGYTNDMLESFKVGNIIHKHNLADPTVAWSEIPAMLFDNNHKIANRYFDTRLGVLEPEAAADVIVVDYKGPTPMNGSNYNGHILFGMNGAMVTDTIIAGEIKMRSREVLGADEARIAADAQAQAQDMWSRVNG